MPDHLGIEFGVELKMYLLTAAKMAKGIDRAQGSDSEVTD